MSNCNSCPSKNSCKSQATCNIKNNPNNNIKKIIAVMSGKGGVGKSTVTALIAKKLNKMGYKVGILDSDITGPSIPRLMNLQNQRAMSNGKDIFPIESKEGIKTMSINYMVDNENQPIVWKGPMVGNAVKNMSYIQCPDCDKKIKLFEGEETEKFLSEMDLKLLGELPMTKEIVNITHNGVSEISDSLDGILTGIVDNIK